MGFFGSVFGLVGKSVTGAVNNMIWTKAQDLRRNSLIKRLDQVSIYGDGGLGEFEASKYLNSNAERLSLFYAYALERGATAYNLATVFRMLFSNSLSSTINLIRSHCTSSISQFADLAMAILETLGKQDPELDRFISRK